MPRNPQISFNVGMRDQSSEIGTFSFLTAVAEDLDAGLSTEMTDLLLAVNDVTLGLVTTEKSVQAKKLSNAKIGAGNREDKIEINYQDNVTLTPYQVELPTRDNTLATSPGLDTYPIGSAPWANFKTKFEAAVVSPDGNPVTVLSFRLVGRNN